MSDNKGSLCRLKQATRNILQRARYLRHVLGEDLKVLVTGGLGFIGSDICKYPLAEHGDFEITNTDKIGFGAHA